MDALVNQLLLSQRSFQRLRHLALLLGMKTLNRESFFPLQVRIITENLIPTVHGKIRRANGMSGGMEMMVRP